MEFYKVVQRWGHTYISAMAHLLSFDWIIEYYPDHWTYPKQGMLLVWDNLAAARRFCGTDRYIWQCEVANPVFTLEFLPCVFTPEFDERAQSFWGAYKPGTQPKVGQELDLAGVQPGTVAVEAVKLTKLIKVPERTSLEWYT